jgi:hypothetical protein
MASSTRRALWHIRAGAGCELRRLFLFGPFRHAFDSFIQRPGQGFADFMGAASDCGGRQQQA